jgi:hypothetical protein
MIVENHSLNACKINGVYASKNVLPACVLQLRYIIMLSAHYAWLSTRLSPLSPVPMSPHLTEIPTDALSHTYS